MSDHDHDHDHAPLPPRIVDAAAAGCEESRMLIERRSFMGISVGLFSSAFLPHPAEAASSADDPRLLIVLLRGGMDGLHLAVPVKDNFYQSARGAIAVPATDVTMLDGVFGLNKKMPNFLGMYQAGQATVVHAIAPPLRVRSHFECMYNIETGYPGDLIRSAQSGWVNRLLQALPTGNAVRVRGALEVGPTPMIMTGPQPVMSWMPGGWDAPANVNAALLKLYEKNDKVLNKLLDDGLKADALANASQAGATGTSILLQAFSGAGALLSNDLGPRIAVLDVAGWDTHVSQDTELPKNFSTLDQALAEFKRACGAAWQRTAVVCVTEFGRTVAVNGRSGTDHGVGTVALLAGGAIAGGKVVADWPGLAKLEDDRDLRATLDLRQLFKGLLQDHLGVPRSLLDTTIFPDSKTAAPLENLIRTPAPPVAMASVTRQALAARALGTSPERLDSPIARYRMANGVFR